MSPLDTEVLYCDHGFPAGRDCWQCWQRRALDTEARIAALERERDEIQIALTEAMRRADYAEEDLRAVVESARAVSGTLKLKDHRGIPKSDYPVVMRDLADVLDRALARPGVRALSSEPPQDVS